MERREFEDSMKEAFRDAELAPGENVWNSIELDLQKSETGKMKKRIFFYQMLAAASITFALIVSGIGFFVMNSKPTGDQIAANNLTQNTSDEIQSKEQDVVTNESSKTSSPAPANDNSSSSDDSDGVIASSSENSTSISSASKHTSKSISANVLGARENKVVRKGQKSDLNNNGWATANQQDNDIQQKESYRMFPAIAFNDERPLPPLVAKTGAVKSLPKPYQSEPDPAAIMLLQLKDLEKQLANEGTGRRKDKNKDEQLWTSVGFAAGGFNSVASGNTSIPRANMAFNNVMNNQTKASGLTYSFGVGMGARLGERWVLQGGVTYLTQSSDYISTQVVGSASRGDLKAATYSDFISAETALNNFIIPTAPYSVNNSLQYISVPVQAGYMLLNRKLALQFNAGVSTDLFLQNTLDPEGDAVSKTTLDNGPDSPYRAVNFSGLVGTELSYRVGNRYRLALTPGLRYPFSSVFKKDTEIAVSPLSFDVGLRFRYIIH